MSDSWVVWRQDDNGNRYIVSRHSSRDDAQRVADGFDARGHRQLYWVDAEPDPAVLRRSLAGLRESVELIAADADTQFRWAVQNGYPVGEIYDQLAGCVPSWFPDLEEVGLVNDDMKRILIELCEHFAGMVRAETLKDDRESMDSLGWRRARKIALGALRVWPQV